MGSNEVIYKTIAVFRINNFTEAITAETGVNNLSEGIVIGSDQWLAIAVLEVDTDGSECLSVYLRLNHRPKELEDESIDVQFTAHIRDIDGHPLDPIVLERSTFQMESTRGPFEGFNYSQLLHQKDKYLPNDSLTIVFDITVYKTIDGPKRRRLFGNSFLNKELNDCRLVVKGKEFPVSKAYISDRSEVFHNMFTTDMSEKTTSDVVIDDIDADVFEEFLRFLYFGDSEKLYALAEELLYVSDKYMVSELKTICENLLYLKLNAKNALNMLEVMERYGNEELVAKIIKYMKINLNQCLESEWHKLVGNDGKLIGKVIDGLKNRKYKKNQTMSYTYIPGL